MFRVLGIEEMDYTNKNGQRIQGTKLHLGYEKENCEGVAVTNEFIGKGLDLSNVKVGDTVKLFYSKFGKVVELSIENPF